MAVCWLSAQFSQANCTLVPDHVIRVFLTLIHIWILKFQAAPPDDQGLKKDPPKAPMVRKTQKGNYYPDAIQSIPTKEVGNPMKTGNTESGFKDTSTVQQEVISLRAFGMPPSCSSFGPSPFVVWDGTHPRIAISEIPAVASVVSYPDKSKQW